MSSCTPRRAAAPPGLHMQPVRREMDCAVAVCSMNVLGIISPEGERNINDTVEPVSACSPTDLRRHFGSRDKIRTTGVPDWSWRNRDNDEVRKCRRDDSRSGRKGRYTERKRSPSVIIGRVR